MNESKPACLTTRIKLVFRVRPQLNTKYQSNKRIIQPHSQESKSKKWTQISNRIEAGSNTKNNRKRAEATSLKGQARLVLSKPSNHRPLTEQHVCAHPGRGMIPSPDLDISVCTSDACLSAYYATSCPLRTRRIQMTARQARSAKRCWPSTGLFRLKSVPVCLPRLSHPIALAALASGLLAGWRDVPNPQAMVG